jgi:hypothetical protein
MVQETIVTEEFVKEMRKRAQVQEGTSLFEASRDNIVVFAEKMLGLRLYAWQIDLLSRAQDLIHGESEYIELAALTSRQIGKSFCLAIIAIWACVFNKYPGTAFNTTVVGVISASDRQAKELLREVKKLLILGDGYMFEKYDRKGFFTALLDAREQNNTEILTFKPSQDSPHEVFLKGAKTGPQIMSYPPTQKVLGKSFTLIFVDEAGRSSEITDEFLLEELFATGSATSSRRILTSTPWAPIGYFYNVVHPDGRYHGQSDVVKYTIEALAVEEHAVKQYEYVMRTMVKPWRAAGDHNAVLRAFYCEFVKGETNFFDPAVVKDIFTKDYDAYEGYDGVCDIGIDWGGSKNSNTVVTVSTLSEDGEIFRLYKKVYKVQEDENLISDLEEDIMVRFPKWQRIIYDDAPVATYILKDLKDKGWEIHPMNFRSDKVKKFGALRSKINRGEVYSFNDDDLLAEMISLEFGTGSRQSRITAPKGGSDDLIDSFVISCFFFLDEDNSVEFFSLYD